MPQFNVRLHFSDRDQIDETHVAGSRAECQPLDLEIYQQVHCAVGTPREAIIQCAKQQFLNWARLRGPAWAKIGARLPSAEITASEILPASDGTTMLR